MVLNIVAAAILVLVLIGIGILIYLIGVKILRPYKKLSTTGQTCSTNEDCETGVCTEFKCV